MFEIWNYVLFVLFLSSTIQAAATCKAIPGSGAWPSLSEWQSFNTSISGRLLQPPPPGAVCHPGQPTYNKATCPMVQSGWLNQTFHAENPISSDYENWNNDSCLPDPQAPCSGAGYPIYVVNASTAQHVQAGVNFAAKHNVRLIVKASGHDFLGRSSAPNSLSIWTRNIGSISFSSDFQPDGCNYHLKESSVTVGAGVFMKDIYDATAAHNLAVLGGGGEHITVGGYNTGGGHSAMSPVHGLGADSVFEMEVVTPAGDIVTANECQHTDLFWAMRGGGGSTFGVITSMTIRTFPSPAIGMYTVTIRVSDSDADAFWDTTTYLFQQMPKLVDAGVGAYIYAVSSSLDYGGLVLLGIFVGVNKTAAAIEAAISPIISYAESAIPPGAASFSSQANNFPSFLAFYHQTFDNSTAGNDEQVASRLLNRDVLATPFKELKSALMNFAGDLGFNAIMMTGKAIWNAKPRGGSDAVNPAWRNNTIVHLVTGATWPPLDGSAKKASLASLEQRADVLRKLAPYSGAYINEGDVDEPNFQQAFWGSNYPRLLSIKKRLDPKDVLWCHPCVGNEGWEVQGDQLCRV